MFVTDRTRPLVKELAEAEGLVTHDLVEASGTTYIGKQNKLGEWVVLKKTGTEEDMSIRYAGKKNNSYTSYSDAWENRNSLTYGYYSEAI
jgi:hypothetical protein